MAHQHLEQLDRSMRESIIGNVASTFLFRLGHNDIRDVVGAFKESEQPLVKQALGSLDIGEVIRREADGSFRAINIHRIAKPKATAKQVSRLRALSCQRYCRRRRDIEAQMRGVSRQTTLRTASQPANSSTGPGCATTGQLIPRRRRRNAAP